MDKLETVTGRAAPFLAANVDTDVIIPMARCVATRREHLGRYAFEPLRYLDDGAENPDFVFNQAAFRDAPILIAGPNFGCGSSREMAVWAIRGMGIRVIIAPSFGDIFFANCFQNSVLPIKLPLTEVETLAGEAEVAGGAVFSIDLSALTIVTPGGRTVRFTVHGRGRKGLLEGLDDIELTLRLESEIAAFQARDKIDHPWIYDAGGEGQ